MSESQPQGWQFEKRVSFGDLLKTAIAVAAIFLFIKDVQMQAELNSAKIEGVTEAFKSERVERKEADRQIRREVLRSEDEMKELMAEVRKSLQRIEDRLSEKADK